ncbi:DinB family protein [Actinokineospora guangxiensis]|uniref:DinB family protein n=1 Tax=Actinokineospora guangxiensis TaxID=1490288 RepID=A0ABW0EUN3_9PSEU
MQVPFDELPSAQRMARASVGDERECLEAFLDLYRDVVVRKVAGVSEKDARRRLVGSSTTLAGIIKHLRVIEMNWFQRRLGLTPDDELPVRVLSWSRLESTFVLDDEETVDDVVAAYREQCDISRQVARAKQLADRVPQPQLGEVTLRWIYLHMIEETARHAGHADILREQIDGHTGS